MKETTYSILSLCMQVQITSSVTYPCFQFRVRPFKGWSGVALCFVYVSVRRLCRIRDKCRFRKENKQELKMNLPSPKLSRFFFLSVAVF